jgi:Transposase DDE domain
LRIARSGSAIGGRRFVPASLFALRTSSRYPYQPPATPEGRINLTDPDSRVVKGLRGFLQGYNAQAVTNEHQVVLAAEIETIGADFGHLEPMLDATQRELAAAGVDELPEVLLADAGYWHGEQMQRIIDRGIEVLIPPDTGRRRTTRRNWDGGRYDEMREVLASDRGGELYRHAPTDDRAGVRPDEVQPRPRSL